jgi:uncharacterized protein DUF6636
MRCSNEAGAVVATIVVLLAGLTSAWPQGARDLPAGFKSPSNNIHCQYFDGELRCDIAQVSSALPPKPRDCELDWGRAFAVAADSRLGQRLCHGDTAIDDSLPALPYGSTWRRGGFTCTSEQSGVTCSNALGHGFSLSRNAQRLF